ncbi:MAG: protein kinase [Candidatus Schekmanbacteria bacterium]|nr:protein kinase [Candidatus Schekmanbacteria bacterium]
MQAADSIGKYELERELASGGMGAIWVARDTLLRRRVAVKVMLPIHTSSAEMRRWFEQEALAIARLRHPNVVQIYDYGLTEDGAPFIVMELLDGESLATRLDRTEIISLTAFLPVFVQAAKALGAAHEVGIVHRDLKPGNIFLARVGAELMVKVLDFGLSGIVTGDGGVDGPLVGARQSLRETGAFPNASSLVGTPRFLSPEQILADENADHRSDLWSLAVVAYRAITGEMPFKAVRLARLLRLICEEKHQPPSAYVPSLGGEVDLFFDRALAKNPADRFQSAPELAAAFSALVAPGGEHKAARVLIVDDEADVETLLTFRFRRQLRKGELELVFARDGEEALGILERNPEVDVVFTDINMPRMDGLTFLSAARKVTSVAKIVIISAYSDMSNLRAAMNRGAFDFLVKPLDLDDLEATLQKALGEVSENRKAMHLLEENAALRMFMDDGLLERVVPMVRAASRMVGEPFEAVVAALALPAFGAAAAALPGDEKLRLLNANLDVIITAVAEEGGVIAKLLGESMLALFRGPEDCQRAARSCRKAREELARRAASGADNAAWFALGVCCGVARGMVVAGSVGSISNQRFDYVLLGDPVTEAMRLQSAASRNEILMTSEVRQALPRDFDARVAASGAVPGAGGAAALATGVSHEVGDGPLPVPRESTHPGATDPSCPRSLARRRTDFEPPRGEPTLIPPAAKSTTSA